MKRFETLIGELLADYPETATFDLVAFELWGNPRDGFDCNSSWKFARSIPRDEVPAHARDRWEVFKANYAPRARVSSLEDISSDPARISLEMDCLPVLDIHPAA